MRRGRKVRLQIVTTVPYCLQTFLAGQPGRLSGEFDVSLISTPGPGLTRAALAEGVPSFGVRLTRSISPVNDLLALVRMYRHFRRTRPDIVQSYTPKAGLVAMTAAALARVPVRVHGVIGMPLMEATGPRRAVLTISERWTYRMATDLTCNSTGLRAWIHRHLDRREITVIGQGSINGVDLERFAPLPAADRDRLRWERGFDEHHIVFLFVGRLVTDKGIAELLAAFQATHRKFPHARLVLVGDDRDPRPNPAAAQVLAAMAADPAITAAGWSDDMASMYGLADVLVLPSYREGMPNAVLEAAAMALPVIATDINGCNEIVEPERTGLLVPPKDPVALAAAMIRLCDLADRELWGRAARAGILARFEHRQFCEKLAAFYRDATNS